MDFGNSSLRSPLVPEPVLRVQAGAAFGDGDLGADSGGAGGAPDGGGGDKARVHERHKMGIHAESGEVQREGARAHYHLRQFRSRKRLRHPLR